MFRAIAGRKWPAGRANWPLLAWAARSPASTARRWLLPNVVVLALLAVFADELPPAVALFLSTLVLAAETLPRARRNARESAVQ